MYTYRKRMEKCGCVEWEKGQMYYYTYRGTMHFLKDVREGCVPPGRGWGGEEGCPCTYCRDRQVDKNRYVFTGKETWGFMSTETVKAW